MLAINRYVHYFINSGTFLLLFSASLTLVAVISFAIRLYALDIKNRQFTPFFSSMMTLINLWIPTKRENNNVHDDDDITINVYVRYFLNVNNFVMIFSSILTSIGIALCIVKLVTVEEDDPQFTIYLTTVISLITLWIPIQYLKSQHILIGQR